jgi:cholesterol transport system auxiliary component
MNNLAKPLLLLGALVLTACSLGGKAVPLTIIEPRIDRIVVDGVRAVDWSVEVPRPVTDQTRDSDRLIVRRDGGRLQIYPGVTWLDRLPDMVQTLLVQSLTDSGQFAGVGREGLGARYVLATELRRFELVDEGGDLRVELVITARLIDQRSRISLGTDTFRAAQPVASSDLTATVSAFEAALSELMAELLAWTLDSGQGEQE